MGRAGLSEEVHSTDFESTDVYVQRRKSCDLFPSSAAAGIPHTEDSRQAGTPRGCCCWMSSINRCKPRDTWLCCSLAELFFLFQCVAENVPVSMEC